MIEVQKELLKAKDKFPLWPEDPLHAFAIVQEEIGELQKAILQCKYEGGSETEVIKELMQSLAMLFRFAASLDENGFYNWDDKSADQYKQMLLVTYLEFNFTK